MYRLKEQYLDFFKETRTIIYADFISCDANFMSSIVNGNKICSETIAKCILSVKFNISLKDEKMGVYLKKYFAKEK